MNINIHVPCNVPVPSVVMYMDYVWHTLYVYICGCIFTAPELVGLWLGSVEIQQAIYRAYEFVTCYDRCTYVLDLYPV